MSIERVALALLATAALASCQSMTPVDRPIPDDELLSGTAVFGERVWSTEHPDVDLVATDEAMRAFVATVAETPKERDRLRTLLDLMRRNGYVANTYEPYLNLTAREAFAAKRGNCLSYTSLFVALAREAGLDAKFQVVAVPPDYDSVDGRLVLNKHVNVRVERVPGRGAVTVEFSEEYASGIYNRLVVTDDYATALHYNNLAFTHARNGDPRSEFVYLRKAIDATPDNPDYWANLGVFYGRQERYDHAVAAHRRALAFDAYHGAAIRGLANAYTALGRDEAARLYRKRIAHSKVRDAYAYFALAQRALEARHVAYSLELLANAVRLFDDDYRFYELQGQAYGELGDDAAAEASFKRARTVARASREARSRDLIERYPRAQILIGGPRVPSFKLLD